MATATANATERPPNATSKNHGPRRRKLIGQRRRVDEDDGGDYNAFDLVDDDSQTDISAASEERAAAHDSDTSNIDDASPTAPGNRKSLAGQIGAETKLEERKQADTAANDTPAAADAATPKADEAVRNPPASGKIASVSTAANTQETSTDASESAPALAAHSKPQQVKAPQPAIISSSSLPPQRRETPYERQRREHDLYKQKRDEDPSFVPNRGSFFMHDHRGAGPAANGFRPFGRGGRGRGRGGYGGLYTPVQSHSHNPADPTINAPWAHDMHDTLVEPAIPRFAPQRRRFDTGSQYGGSQVMSGTIPTCPPSVVPINRSMSVEKPLGVVTVRVFFPPMKEAVLFEKFKVVQYTKLPDHRPPLRRDKAVVIDLPGHPKRQIFPAIDRSFIFIPRALRPNQQRLRGNRARSVMGSISGFSRQTSIFGGSYYNGSMYSPSVALSRRSSITHDASRDFFISPAGSAISRPALHVDNSNRPVVRLPPVLPPNQPPSMVPAMPMGSMGFSMSAPPRPPSGFMPAPPPGGPEGFYQLHQNFPPQPPPQPPQVPEGSSLSTVPPPQNHPLPQRPTFQENRPSHNLPMHQPRPQKAVSVDTLDPQAAGYGNQPSQQPPAPMPFHQQVPIQMASGFPPGENHSRRPSYPSYTAGTPLSQIPERAIHAAPFQPHLPVQPGMYPQPNTAASGPFYNGPGYTMMQPQPPPQQGYFYPTPPNFPSTMAPSASAPAFVPAGAQQGGPGFRPLGQRDMSGIPVQNHGLVAQEANGMVYYYDPSNLPGVSNFPPYAPPPAPPGGFVPGMGGMVTPTPPEGYHYPPQPGMMYYQQ